MVGVPCGQLPPQLLHEHLGQSLVPTLSPPRAGLLPIPVPAWGMLARAEAPGPGAFW